MKLTQGEYGLKNETVYIPVLKWKQGERLAVQYLDKNIRTKIKPLFVIMDQEDPDLFLTKILKSVGPNSPFYIDVHSNADISPEIINNFIDHIITQGDENSLFCIPVINSERDNSYHKLLKNKAPNLKNGVAIRLKTGDFSNCKRTITKIIDNTGFSTSKIDLFIDLGIIQQLNDIDEAEQIADEMISKMRSFNFRSIILCGSSFPPELGGRDAFSITQIVRQELIIWDKINKKHNDVLFGDYVVDDPDLPTGLDFRFVRIVPTIRYTREKCWYIIRGQYQKPLKYEQFHQLSQKVLSSGFYSGQGYSWGDDKIYECGSGPCKGRGCKHGNLTTWVTVGTNHHIVFTVNQLANYFFS